MSDEVPKQAVVIEVAQVDDGYWITTKFVNRTTRVVEKQELRIAGTVDSAMNEVKRVLDLCA